MSTSQAHHHHPVLGAFLKLLSVALLSSMAACVKYLGDAIPSGETIFVRGVISIALLAAVAWRTTGLGVLKTRRLRSHAIRSLSGTASMFCWYTALTLIPLAEFTAISFTTPMFVTILAMLVLGERIHRYRWTALAVGFAGVLIMVGPHLSFKSSTLGVGIALGAAVFSGIAMLTVRSMSGASGEHAIAITFYFSLTSMLCAAFTVVGGWPAPTPRQWLAILGVGVFGGLGQLLMTLSYRYAEVSTIAPLDYANLLFAVGYGWFFFAELPPLSIFVGAPLVIAAGLIILWREYRNAIARALPARQGVV